MTPTKQPKFMNPKRVKKNKTVKVKAWANVNGLNGQFYAACTSKTALEARSDDGDIIIPCTITYSISATKERPNK